MAWRAALLLEAACGPEDAVEHRLHEVGEVVRCDLSREATAWFGAGGQLVVRSSTEVRKHALTSVIESWRYSRAVVGTRILKGPA